MESKNVVILGGGPIALATAVDFISSGFKVNIFELPRFKKNVQDILGRGGVEFSGVVGNGFAKLNMVTTDVEEALRDVSLIVLAVPAFGHKAFVEACVPHLRDGQIFFIKTAYFACLRFANAFKNTGKRIILAEMNSTPYACRKIGPAQLFISEKRKELFVAALPARDTRKVVELLKSVYPGTTAVPNVLQTSFDLANWMIHPPVTLFHRGLIERTTDFTLPVKDSIPPSVIRLMEAMEKERLELGRAFGLDLLPIKHFWELGGESLEETLRGSREFETYNFEYKNGSHQYMREDLYYGLPTIASIANLVKVPTPTIDALVHIFSVIDGVEYMKEGVNVEKLGFTGLSVKEILKIVEEGY